MAGHPAGSGPAARESPKEGGPLTIVRCPGCGYQATPDAELPDPPAGVSRECWWCYCQLLAYDAQRAHRDFVHQEAVDAYAAQHPGKAPKLIARWFALVGLHLAIDRGMTGRAVQRAHGRLAGNTIA